MPQSPIGVRSYPAGASPYNTAAATAGFQIKTGAGTLQNVNINVVGSGSLVTLYDGTSTAGKKLASVPGTALGNTILNLQYVTGLFVVVTATAPDVTIGYF